MTAVMDRQTREAFLADVHVGVVSIEHEGRPPITVPIWYSYTPGGEVRFITDAESLKARALRTARRFSLCAQSETRPYRYVSVAGAVVALDPVDVERDLRPLARRYLGLEAGDRYVEEVGGAEAGEGSILVRMRPTCWSSADESQGS